VRGCIGQGSEMLGDAATISTSSSSSVDLDSVQDDRHHAGCGRLGNLQGVRLAVHVILDPKVTHVHQIHAANLATETVLVERMAVNARESTCDRVSAVVARLQDDVSLTFPGDVSGGDVLVNAAYGLNGRHSGGARQFGIGSVGSTDLVEY